MHRQTTRAHCYSYDTAVEEIAGTVIACYLSSSDACNLSSTILIRTRVDIQSATVVKWFIATPVIRLLSLRNLTLRDVSSKESLSLYMFTKHIVTQIICTLLMQCGYIITLIFQFLKCSLLNIFGTVIKCFFNNLKWEGGFYTDRNRRILTFCTFVITLTYYLVKCSDYI